MRRPPFGRRSVWTQISHPEAAKTATDPLSIDDGAIPRSIIAHGAFDREFTGVAVYDNKNEPSCRH
jgi:hypothetical protein